MINGIRTVSDLFINRSQVTLNHYVFCIRKGKVQTPISVYKVVFELNEKDHIVVVGQEKEDKHLQVLFPESIMLEFATASKIYSDRVEYSLYSDVEIDPKTIIKMYEPYERKDEEECEQK